MIKTSEHFYKDKSKTHGLASSCKECVKTAYLQNKKSSNVTRLTVEERRKNKINSQRKYREANKDKLNAIRREKYKQNPEKHAEWGIRNKDKVSAYKRKWKQNNKYNPCSGDFARRRQEKLATPKWMDEFDRFLINEIYDLARKRTNLLGIAFEVDHIVPIMSDIVCGLHHPLNLEIVEAKINRKKNNLIWPNMPEKE